MSRLTSFAATSIVALAFAAPGIAGDFDGAYGGGNIAMDLNVPNLTDYEIGAFVGYNFAMGTGFVAGGEMDVTYNADSVWGLDVMTSTVDGRLGYLLGNDVMVYGRLGGGYTTGGPGSMVWDLGAGAEINLFDQFTVRGEVDRVDPFEAGMDTQVNGRLGVILDF